MFVVTTSVIVTVIAFGAAAKPLADLDAKVKEVGTTGDRFLGQVYAELKAAR